MSEMPAMDAAGQQDIPTGASASPGALLRAAREARGMHIEALAVALKVPIARVQALEADDFSALPDAVFARALASSVCRALKVDAAPILALMPTGAVPRLEPQKSDVNAVFRDGSEPSRMGPVLGALLRPGVLAVAVLLAGAAALFFFPGVGSEAQDWWQKMTAERAAVQAPAPAKTVVEPVAPAQAPTAPVVMPSAAVVPASAASPAPAGVEALAATVPAATLALAPVAEAAPVADAGPVAGADVLLALRASSPSWVQVRDAAGAVVLERILAAGENAKVSGKPPYAVVIGKADATEVYVRGQRFDLARVTRENVARFEVKP